MPGLSNALDSDGYGTEAWAATVTLPWPLASVKVAVASSSLGPGEAPAGTVTCHVVWADWPGATWLNEEGDVAVTVQPLGAVSATLTLRRGALPVLGSDVVAVMADPGVTTGGAVSVNGCWTVTGVEPVTPLTMTLMVATPWAIMVILPPGLIEATLGLLLWYLTVAWLRSAKDWSLLTASTTLSAVACGCSSEEFVSLAIHGFLPVRFMVSPGLNTTWSG